MFGYGVCDSLKINQQTLYMNIQSLQSYIQSVLSIHSDQFSSQLNSRFNICSKVSVSEFSSIQQHSQDKSGRIRSFDNKQNFYLRALDLLEKYSKQQRNMLQFFYQEMSSGCMDVPMTGWNEAAQKKRMAKVNHFLARMELWARKSDEVRIILKLFVSDRRDLIELYLKLRRRILSLSASETVVNKNYTISTHNMAKYSKPMVESIEKSILDVHDWVALTETVLTVYAKKFKFQEVVDFIHQSTLYFGEPTILSKMKGTTYVMIALYILQQSKGTLQTSNKPSMMIADNPQSPTRLNKTSMMMFTSYTNKPATKLQFSDLKVLSHSIDLEQVQKLDEKTKYDYTYRVKTEQEEQRSPKMSTLMGKMHHQVEKKRLDGIVTNIRKQFKEYVKESRHGFHLELAKTTSSRHF